MKPVLLLPLMLLLVLPAPPGYCRAAAGHGWPEKNGQCPPSRTFPSRSCDNFCISDGNCPGSERCCSTGCGRECRLPVGAKRGFCPQQVPGRATICLVQCSRDSDCQGNEKCCSSGCHVHCMRPVPAKPGVCPKRKVLHTLLPCNSSCHDDSDCPQHEKCCFTGCSLRCLPPARGTTALLLPASLGHQPGPAASNATMSSSDVCHLRIVRGPCRGRFRRYAYNPATGTCQPFIYSGCGGNPNNFNTAKECQQICQKLG